MKSNLPPGTTDAMIPGNSEQDAEWERFLENVSDRLGRLEATDWYFILDIGLAMYQKSLPFIAFKAGEMTQTFLTNPEDNEDAESVDADAES